MVSICSSLQHSTSCLSVSGKKTDQNNISSSCKYFFFFFSQIFLLLHLANMWHYQNAHYTNESTHFINIWLKPKSHRNISVCVSQQDKNMSRDIICKGYWSKEPGTVIWHGRNWLSGYFLSNGSIFTPLLYILHS